jgi:hypothetical protein
MRGASNTAKASPTEIADLWNREGVGYVDSQEGKPPAEKSLVRFDQDHCGAGDFLTLGLAAQVRKPLSGSAGFVACVSSPGVPAL